MRRVVISLAVALVVGGLSILGYFGWQYVGSNIVAAHHQREGVERLVRSWDDDTIWIDAESGEVAPGLAASLVHIPRFGKSYVMPILEGTTDRELARGIGHVLTSAPPGQKGNFALAAHRVTHGEPFANLPELRPGDLVIVETRTKIYTYVMDTDPNELVLPYTATWVLAVFPHNPDEGVGPDPRASRRLITLTTCAEVFATDERMVAFGHLKRMTAK